MVKKKIKAGKWKDLPMDLLVDVLGRVDLESLLIDVPWVCKSWFKASLNPLCWKQLVFPSLDYIDLFDEFSDHFKSQYGIEGEICETKLIKGVIDRSAGFATMVDLNTSCIKDEALISYVVDKCPALKKLTFYSEHKSDLLALSLVIGKLKNLESLVILSGFLMKEIVTEIGFHCENFVALTWDGDGDGDWVEIEEEDVMAIVTYLPKIKRLALTGLWIEREDVIKILKGCRELVDLYVSNCGGFNEKDEEILKLASHIPIFDCSGPYRYSSDLVTSDDDEDNYG